MEPEVVQTIHDAFRKALHDPTHLAVLARFDMPVRYLDSQGFTADAAICGEPIESETMASRLTDLLFAPPPPTTSTPFPG